jgi:hypothetical protein
MSTSNNTLPTFSTVSTAPVESETKPTTRQSEESRENSLDEWIKRGIARLNDQTTPFPRVW